MEYRFELYVVGRSAKGLDAEANIRRICAAHLAGRYELEVTDVLESPEAAEEANIVATPTLVRWRPLPVRVIVGDLSSTIAVEHGLGLTAITTRVVTGEGGEIDE
jgi:circadian clock protein KaiB